MKTAMQELIDELERVRLMTNMNFVIRIATDLLEKEKEQMLNFYMWMRMNENTEKYLDYSDEDMFKEYLNQNK
jgi:hypothetical protein